MRMEIIALVYIVLALSILSFFMLAVYFLFKDFFSHNLSTSEKRFRLILYAIIFLTIFYVVDGPITAGCRPQYNDNSVTSTFSGLYCSTKEALGISTPRTDSNWSYTGFFK